MPDIEDLKTLAGRGGQLGQVTALQDTDALGIWRGASGSMQLGYATVDALRVAMPAPDLPIVRVQDIGGLIDDGQTNAAAAINADMAARQEPARYVLRSAANAFVINTALNNPRHVIEWESRLRLGASGQIRIAGTPTAVERELATDAVRGDTVLELESVADLAVGDVVLAMDDKLASDVIGSSPNPIHVDPRRIVDISGTDVLLDLPLDHDLETAFNARVVKVDAATGAWHLFGPAAEIEFTQAPSSVVHTTEVAYGFASGMRGVRILNRDSFGSQGIALRLFRSLGCLYENCTVVDPKFTAASQGYGLAMYYSSRCFGRQLYLSGCRHGALFIGSGWSGIQDFTIADVRLNGADFHGLEEIGCFAYRGSISTSGRTATGATTQNGANWGNPTHLQPVRDCFIHDVEISGFKGSGRRAVHVIPPTQGGGAFNVRIRDCHDGLSMIEIDGQPSLTTAGFAFAPQWVHGLTGNLAYINGAHFAGDTTRRITDVRIAISEARDCASGLILRNSGVRVEDGWYRDPTGGGSDYALDARNIVPLKVIGPKIEGFNRPIRLEDCPDAEVLVYPMDVQHSPVGVFNGVWFDAGGNDGARVQDGFDLGGGA